MECIIKGDLSEVIGIYQIFNKRNSKKYIGKSVNVGKRIKQHIRELRNGTHHNKFLQNDFYLHGELSFQITLLEECEENNLDDFESVYCYENDVWNKQRGYNIAKLKNVNNVKTKVVRAKYKVIDTISSSKTITEALKKYGQVEVPTIKISEKLGMQERMVKKLVDLINTDDKEPCGFVVQIGDRSVFNYSGTLLITTSEKQIEINNQMLDELERVFA